MKKHLYLLIVVSGVLFLFSGCATILHGSRQDVSISSSPSAASVYIDGQLVGKTPLITPLKRNENHLVKIQLDGYAPYEAAFTRKVDIWIAGNIIFGGFIGLGIDAITGSMYKLTPSNIQAQLQNNTASNFHFKDGIYLTVVLKADPEWEKIGQLKKMK